MKKLCEIYDVSTEYNMSDNSLFIIVSDLTTEQLLNALPEIENVSAEYMRNEDWNEFAKICNEYRKNDNKFHMREVRHSKEEEIYYSLSSQLNNIDESLEKQMINERIVYALSFLKEQPKRRFLRYYFEQYTYREIALLENRQISTIYESIQGAKKNFVKHFNEYPI